MKKTGKQILKSALIAVLSLMLAVVIFFGGTSALAITASAETSQTITVGETWHGSWLAAQKYEYFEFKVTESGFYNLTVTDHKQTAETHFSYWDLTSETETGGHFIEEIKETPYIIESIYLIAGHKYCAYYNYCKEFYNDQTERYNTINYDAEASVKISKSSCTPTALSSNVTSVNLNNNTKSWLSFQSSQAGDYTLNISDTSVNIYGDLYNATTGEIVEQFDSEYYNCNYDYIYADKIVLKLDANTKYYLHVLAYSGEADTYSIKLSVTKNAKNVKSITLNTLKVDYGIWFGKYDVDYHWFDYKVSYTDGTSSIMECYEIKNAGLKTPDIQYLGNSSEINGGDIATSGKHLVIANYNGITSTLSINVPSLFESCLDYAPLYPDDIAVIEYEDREKHSCYWRLKTKKTAVYNIYNYNYINNTLNDNLEYCSAIIVDEKNNVVNFNENAQGWPLVAGREYVVILSYQYNSHSTNSVKWWLQKVGDSLFPDTYPSGWYHDAVTYSAGCGIMKGYANGKFGTSDGIQRQDFLVMLARLDGVILERYSYQSSFPDVGTNSYYEAAVNWGYENGIVTGYENGRFGVGDMINREQIVTFLHRYAIYKWLDVNVSETSAAAIQNQYADYSSVSGYAQDAMLWAIDRGVMNGKNATTIAPAGTAQRCEIAQIMYNIFTNKIFF